MSRCPGETGATAALILFGVVFLFIGAIFFGIGASTYIEEGAYQRQGVEAQGLVTAKTLRRATSNSDTSYDISYKFNLADGRSHQQNESVPVHLWERVEPGTALTVEYMSGESISARVVRDRSESRTMSIVAMSIGGGLIVLALYVFTSMRLKHLLERSSPSSPIDPDTALPTVKDISDRDQTRHQSYWPTARQSFGFWFGGIWLICGLPFALVGVFQFYDDWRFAREARSIDGMVLTKEIRRSSSNRSRSSETKHYEATYRFTIGTQTIEGRDELTLDAWSRLVEREPVHVLYRARQRRSEPPRRTTPLADEDAVHGYWTHLRWYWRCDICPSCRTCQTRLAPAPAWRESVERRDRAEAQKP